MSQALNANFQVEDFQKLMARTIKLSKTHLTKEMILRTLVDIL